MTSLRVAAGRPPAAAQPPQEAFAGPARGAPMQVDDGGGKACRRLVRAAAGDLAKPPAVKFEVAP